MQYAGDEYQAFLARQDMECRMSRLGNRHDNAVVEIFFRTLKTEFIHHRTFTTRNQARLILFRYLTVYYNRNRRHFVLGYRGPAGYEVT